jgi:hypothetical protein
LNLCNESVLGDEDEQLSAPVEWQWDDESHENGDLKHQEDEYLERKVRIGQPLML